MDVGGISLPDLLAGARGLRHKSQYIFAEPGTGDHFAFGGLIIASIVGRIRTVVGSDCPHESFAGDTDAVLSSMAPVAWATAGRRGFRRFDLRSIGSAASVSVDRSQLPCLRQIHVCPRQLPYGAVSVKQQ